jgi:hypothetical protein
VKREIKGTAATEATSEAVEGSMHSSLRPNGSGNELSLVTKPQRRVPGPDLINRARVHRSSFGIRGAIQRARWRGNRHCW